MKILGFLFLVVGITAKAPAQSLQLPFDYKVYYRMDFRTDSNSMDSRSKDMILLVGKEGSLFESFERYTKDSVLYHHNPEEWNQRSMTPAMPISLVQKEDYLIHKQGADIITYDGPFGSRDLKGKKPVYRYKEKIEDLDWQVTEEMDSIGGFECQKALLEYGGRLWTAYFTPEIDIHDGPYKFTGLPGLIIKISDETDSWEFNLTAVEHTEGEVIANFQKWFEFQNKEKREFFEDRKSYQENLINTINGMGGGLPKEAEEAYSEKEEKDNNWIELY